MVYLAVVVILMPGNVIVLDLLLLALLVESELFLFFIAGAGVNGCDINVGQQHLVLILVLLVELRTRGEFALGLLRELARTLTAPRHWS